MAGQKRKEGGISIRGEGEEMERAREGRHPQFTFLATPLKCAHLPRVSNATG